MTTNHIIRLPFAGFESPTILGDIINAEIKEYLFDKDVQLDFEDKHEIADIYRGKLRRIMYKFAEGLCSFHQDNIEEYFKLTDGSVPLRCEYVGYDQILVATSKKGLCELHSLVMNNTSYKQKFTKIVQEWFDRKNQNTPYRNDWQSWGSYLEWEPVQYCPLVKVILDEIKQHWYPEDDHEWKMYTNEYYSSGFVEEIHCQVDDFLG